MSRIEEFRQHLDIIRTKFDGAKEALSKLNEDHKQLAPNAEFDAIVALKNAEANYYIIELEKKIEILESQIQELESQDQEN